MKIEQNYTSHSFSRFKWVLCICALIGLNSCNVYKYLDEEEILLTNQKIDIVDDQELENSISAKSALTSLMRPEVNSKSIVFRSRLNRYLKAREDNPDIQPTKKMERPVLVDSTRIQQTGKKMESYLRQTGYFKASVEYEINYGKKRGKVKYLLDPGERLYVDTIAIWSQDSAIQKILDQHKNEQILKEDIPLSVDNYERERSRIVALLRNNGYASFYPNYVDIIKSDSLGNGRLEVLQLYDSLAHTTYKVRDINVYLNDLDQTEPTKTDTIDNILYHYSGERPYVNLGLLDKKFLFTPGSVYDKSKIDRSRVLLGGIPALRKIDYGTSVAEDGENIDFDVRISRQNQYAYNIDLTSAYAIVLGNRNRFGLSGSVGLTNRNWLKKGWLFNTEIEGGIEIAAFSEGSEGNFLNTNFQWNNRFQIPDFLDFSKSYWLFNKIKLLPDRTYEGLQESATTNVRANGQYVGFADYFEYWNFEMDIFQNIQHENSTYRLTQSGISIWLPNLSDTFLSQNDPNIIRSFDPRIITGLTFKNLDWQYTKSKPRGSSTVTFLANVDISGLEMWGVNALYNAVSDHEGGFKFGDLGFAHYAKLDLEARYSRKIKNSQSIHFRANTGIVRPYAFSDQVPYVAQFGIGGPYSLRGWDIRELGPGRKMPPTENLPATFANKGDFKIEVNAEYRFPLWWLFQGALFVDAGNVWNINSENAEENLNWNFLDEMAIGAGWGVRFDYEYFVLRFDLGYKFRQPFTADGTPEGTQWQFENIKLLQNTNFVIGVGYPF